MFDKYSILFLFVVGICLILIIVCLVKLNTNNLKKNNNRSICNDDYDDIYRVI